MKKIFTTVALASALGFATANATDVTLTFDGMANANELVTVYQISNASDPNSTPKEWESVEPSNTVAITESGFTEFVINVEEGYYLTGDWTPLQSTVTITELTEDVVEHFVDRNGKLNGLFVSVKSGAYGNIYDDTVITVTVHSGTNNGQENTTEPIPVKFNIPDDATGLIQSLTFLGETTEIASDINPEEFAVQFSRNVADEAPLYIYFRTDDSGTPVYYVGNVEASFISSTTNEIVAAKASTTEMMATVIIPSGASEVNVYFYITDPDKGYLEYTINVNIPEGITVADNEGNVIALEGESNVLKAVDYDIISINANSGYKITDVTNGNGLAITGYASRIEIKDGLVINVTVEEAPVVEETFTVTFEADAFESAYYTTDGTNMITFDDLNGSNTITYDPAMNQQYQIVAVPKEGTEIYVFTNGISYGASASTTVYYGKPYNGLSLEVYVNEPSSYSVSLTSPYEAVDATEVTVDGIVWTNWASGSDFFMLEESEIEVVVPVIYDLYVNEEKQDPETTANGYKTYSVTVTSDLDLAIEVDAAVEIVKSDLENVRNIYNLQGVKVSEKNLGKGLYIINGKKVLVK